MLFRGFYHVFVTTWATLTGLINGETRCYCNEANCVRTAYMCKSTLGACFTLLTPDGGTGPGNGVRFIHGCVDILTYLDQQTCDDDVIHYDVMKSKSARTEWPRLRCCRQDMCNYIDHVTHLSDVKKANTRSETGYNGEVPHDRWPFSGDLVATIPPTSQQQSRDVWFRVGVIAVPIIGAFILICLVVIAARLLSVDRHRRRHHHHYHCCQHTLTCASCTASTNQSRLTAEYSLTSALNRIPIGQNSIININTCNNGTPTLTAAPHVVGAELCCCNYTCKCRQINHITCIFGQDYELIPSLVGEVKRREEGKPGEAGGLLEKKKLNVLCDVDCNQSRHTTLLCGQQHTI